MHRMPLLSYFLVVGASLAGLIVLSDAVLPPAKPVLVSSNFDGLAAPKPPRSRRVERDWTPAPAPDMSAAAVVAAAPNPPVVADADPARAATVADGATAVPAKPAPAKRRHVTAKHAWREHYARADDWSWGPSWNEAPPSRRRRSSRTDRAAWNWQPTPFR